MTAATVESDHRPALDGLRAVAVLAVLGYHFLPDQVPGGFLGVDVFFVLSGYLITALLLREARRDGRISLGLFYVRRLRRLLPASLLLLSTVAVGAWLFASPFTARSVSEDGLWSLANLANWHFVSSGQSYVEQFLDLEPSVLRHMWSLAIEEQFYFVWPVVVALVVAAARRRRGPSDPAHFLLAIALAAASASAVVMFVMAGRGFDVSRMYYGTDTRAHQLLIGVALACLPPRIVEALLRPRRVVVGVQLLALAALGAGFATAQVEDAWLYRGGFVAVGLCVAPLVLAGASPRPDGVGRLLSVAPLTAIGRVSYGLYLWHWPMVIWIDRDSTGLADGPVFALRTVAAFAAAGLSYRLVERPIRNSGLRILPGALRPVAVVATVATIAAGTWLLPGHRTQGAVDPATYLPAAGATMEAYSATPWRCDVPPAGDLAEGLMVVVLGNSISVEMQPCLTEMIERQGGRLVSLANNADALCDMTTRLAENPIEPAGDNVVVVFFHLPFWNTGCGLQVQIADRDGLYRDTVASLVEQWVDAGYGVVLGAPPAAVEGVEDLELRSFYADLETAHPGRVAQVDAGRYLRLPSGEYVFSLPCESTEAGCVDGMINVRFPRDGHHYCADPAWIGGSCAPEYAGGPRRVAAAIAEELFALVAPDR